MHLRHYSRHQSTRMGKVSPPHHHLGSRSNIGNRKYRLSKKGRAYPRRGTPKSGEKGSGWHPLWLGGTAALERETPQLGSKQVVDLRRPCSLYHLLQSCQRDTALITEGPEDHQITQQHTGSAFPHARVPVGSI